MHGALHLDAFSDLPPLARPTLVGRGGGGCWASEAELGPPAPQSTVLFQDVRIFDGKSRSLSAPSNVLVRQQDRENLD
jgi:hypothetical protein